MAAPTRIQLRGLPWHVSPIDVETFFAPAVPIDIRVGHFDNGRSTGDGYVEFASIHEAKEAMKKDRQTIGNRYCELKK